MSLYSDAKTTQSVHFFNGKRMWQVGFVLLGVSALLRIAERFISIGLHWDELQWTMVDWLYIGVLNLISLAFAFVFLRYLSERYNRTLVVASFTLTVIGTAAYSLVILGYTVRGIPHVIPLIGDWCSVLGMSGSPLSCVFGPFMDSSRTGERIYELYIVSADYVIKSVFLGMSVMKYSKNGLGHHEEKPGLAYHAHA